MARRQIVSAAKVFIYNDGSCSGKVSLVDDPNDYTDAKEVDLTGRMMDSMYRAFKDADTEHISKALRANYLGRLIATLYAALSAKYPGLAEYPTPLDENEMSL